jgi:homoserine dehydrogenase
VSCTGCPASGGGAGEVKPYDNGQTITRVGVLGCGNVGSALCRILAEEAGTLADTTGIRLDLTGVAVRDVKGPRNWQIPPGLAADAKDLIIDPEIDVVVELIGGTGVAGDFVAEALRNGKAVVTANKDLLADRGEALHAAAEAAGTRLYYEAAVGGALPLIRTLQLSMAGEPILNVAGILNGTTNYILTTMTETGQSFRDALSEAQKLGYAEPDPSADISGRDAAAKAAIIARIAFGVNIRPHEVHCEGIVGLPRIAFEIARDLGCVIKLLATVDLAESDAGVVARVHPALVPRSHVLASVGGAFNAVYIRGAWLGEGMIYGQGAGPLPTASAVLSDVLSAARKLPAPQRSAQVSKGVMADRPARFCIAVKGSDRPGVLATVDGLFARHGIAVATIAQQKYDDASVIVLTTRPASERAVARAMEALRDVDVVDDIEVAIRFMDP